jgi:site-specific recombinase XerD
VTPLRQRLIDDLRVRNYSPETIKSYVWAVAKLARHFGRSPDQLTPDDLRAFQVHLVDAKASWSQFNQITCGLRFFFGVTLGRPDAVPFIAFGKRPRRLPTVLSPEEVAALLAAASPGRDRALFQTAYACGLRLRELLLLEVDDIDSARMVIRVRHGKGAKQRQVPLSPRLLGELRAYWTWHRSRPFVFPGAHPGRPLTDTTVQKLFQRVRRRAGVARRCSPHTLRHSFATHLLESGVDLFTLKALMGHESLGTTTRYLHVSRRLLERAPSLLDLIALPPARSAGEGES